MRMYQICAKCATLKRRRKSLPQEWCHCMCAMHKSSTRKYILWQSWTKKIYTRHLNFFSHRKHVSGQNLCVCVCLPCKFFRFTKHSHISCVCIYIRYIKNVQSPHAWIASLWTKALFFRTLSHFHSYALFLFYFFNHLFNFFFVGILLLLLLYLDTMFRRQNLQKKRQHHVKKKRKCG